MRIPAARAWFFISLLSAATACPVVAATLTWDAGGGSGNWGTATNWNPDATPATNDDLVFDTSGTVLLSNNTTANNIYSLTFNSGASAFTVSGNGITLDGTHSLINNSASLQTFSNPFVLSGTATVSPASGPVAISGNLTGSGNLTKSGASTLTLTGANTYSGTTLINAGTLSMTAGSVVGSTSLLLRDGGALSISNATFTNGGSGGNFTVGYQSGAGTVTVGSGGVLNVGNGGGRTFIGGGESGGPFGTGVLTLQAGGAVNFAAGGAFPNEQVYLSGYGGAGTINLDGGVLTSARNLKHGSGAGPSVFNFNGGTYRANGTLGTFIDSNITTANVRNGGAIIDSNGFNISILKGLVHSTIGGDAATDGGFIKNGLGTLTMTGTSTFNGPTTINGGTLRLSSAAGSIWNSSIAVNGGATLEINSTAPNDATPDWSTNRAFTGAGTVNKTGTGWFFITNGSVNMSGQINVVDGIWSNSSTAGISWAGNTAGLDIASIATFNVYGNNTVIGALTGSGQVIQTNTAVSSTPNLSLGNGGGSGTFSGSISNTAGTLSLTKAGAGTQTLSGALSYTGQTTVSGGTLNISGSMTRPGSPTTNPFVVQGGGTLNLSGTINSANGGGGAVQVGLTTPGTLNVTGGTVITTWANGNGWGIGNAAAGTVNITGGTMTMNGDDVFYVGWTGTGGAGTLNVSGSGVLDISGTAAFNLGNTSPAAGTVNLETGGLIKNGRNITKGGGTGTFNFNGGTLEATASSASYMTGLTRANVRNGGAVINTGANNITIGQALLHSDIGGDAAIDGGLTKSGTGALTLSSLGSYTGQTRVYGGTLAYTAGAALSETAGSNGAFGLVPSSANPSNILLDGGTLQNSITSGDFTLHANRGIKLGTSGTNQIRANSGGFFRYNGVISDNAAPASLTIASGGGSGWVPGGQSTYSGGTILAAGSSSIPVVNTVGPAGAPTSGPFGAGTLTLAGGQIRASTTVDISLANAVVISADTTFATGGAADKDLIFTGPATLAGGTRTLTGLTSTSAGKSVQFLGAIGDGGNGYGITKAGAGTLALGSSSSTFTGPTTINAGAIRITSGSEQALGANPSAPNANQLLLNGGTLQVSTANLTIDDSNRGVALGISGGTFLVDSALTFTLSKEVAGSGGQLNKAGAGTLDLTAGALLGGMNVSAGTLRQSSGTVSVANPITVGSGATYSLAGGKLRTDSVTIAGTFDWGGGVLNHYTTGTSLPMSADNSSAGFQQVGVGRTLTVNGNLASGGGSVLALTGSPTLYESLGIRFNNLAINGDFSLSGVGDELQLELNPYLLRPFSTTGTAAIEFGSLPLVTWTGADPTGAFDTVSGITNDGRGFALSTFAVTTGSALDINTYFLEYDNANNTLWFHYKVNGYVPEPGTFGLLALGAGFLRVMRRLRQERARITA